MTKADRYMEETISQILNQGYRDINPRPKYADGTPAHTISINHIFRTYDLSQGEFQFAHFALLLGKQELKRFLLFIKNLQM